jgi:ATP-binding cassette, subfamily C, bacterial
MWGPTPGDIAFADVAKPAGRDWRHDGTRSASFALGRPWGTVQAVMIEAMLRRSIVFARSFAGFAGRRAVTAFVLVLVCAALEGVGIVLLVPVLDLVIGHSSKSAPGFLSHAVVRLNLDSASQQLLAVLVCFIALIALRGLLLWARDIRLMRLSLGFVDHWRARLFNALTAAEWATSSGLERARVEHAIMDDVARIATGTERILRGLANLGVLLAQGLIALVLSPVLTALVLAFVAISAAVSMPMVASARRIGGRLTVAGQAMFELIYHFLSGLKLAKAHRAEAMYVDRFDRALTDVRHQVVDFASRQTMMRVVFQFFTGVLAAVVILVGVLVLKTPVAVLAVFTLILARLTGPFLALLQNLQQFANMLPAFDNVTRLLADLESAQATSGELQERFPEGQRYAARTQSGTPQPIHQIGRSALVELRDVSFAHPGQPAPAFANVSLTIEAGEFVGFVGPSGAGKTTLADIIAGLLVPQTGSVLVGGRRLTGQVRADWQDRLAYVPQEPFLFDYSIRDNLTWGREGIPDGALWRALQAAAADDVVRKLPHGLATRVGERGQTLSGGERQRLCLARALARRPALLILDEATNALDRATEDDVLARLEMLRHTMTIVMISHRATGLDLADRVVEFAPGSVRVRASADRAPDVSVRSAV